MFQSHQVKAPRPAGESDEDSISSDDDGFDVPGFQRRRKQHFIQQREQQSNMVHENNNSVCEATEEDWGIDPAEVNSSHSGNLGSTSTPLEDFRLSCTRGNIEKLKSHIEKNQIKVNDFFTDGYTPLITASAHGHPDVVEFLLTQHADVDLFNRSTDRTTALMAAVACTSRDEEKIFKCVKLLVEAKANVNSQNSNGISPLGIAIKNCKIKNERLKVARFLLDNGADPNLLDMNGRTCLFYAAEMGAGRTCRFLLEKGANVHIVDDSGWSAAEIANDKGFFRLGELLHIVLESKWRPGLNPKLMQEIDEEAALVKKDTPVADGITIREDSQIELLLTSLNAQKYIDNFRKHKISYIQFLQLEEEQLKEIGIDEFGIRKKLADTIREVHNTEWAKSSLKMVPVNKKITAAEAVCMVNSIKLHLQHMSATMRSMINRTKRDPLSLQYGKEKNKIQDLISLCKEMNVCNGNLDVDILDFLRFLQNIEGHAEFKLGDEVQPQSLEQLLSRWNTQKNTNLNKSTTDKDNKLRNYKWIAGFSLGVVVVGSCCSSRVRNLFFEKLKLPRLH